MDLVVASIFQVTGRLRSVTSVKHGNSSQLRTCGRCHARLDVNVGGKNSLPSCALSTLIVNSNVIGTSLRMMGFLFCNIYFHIII